MTALHFINPDQINILFPFLTKALLGSSNPVDIESSKNPFKQVQMHSNSI